MVAVGEGFNRRSVGLDLGRRLLLPILPIVTGGASGPRPDSMRTLTDALFPFDHVSAPGFLRNDALGVWNCDDEGKF